MTIGGAVVTLIGVVSGVIQIWQWVEDIRDQGERPYLGANLKDTRWSRRGRGPVFDAPPDHKKAEDRAEKLPNVELDGESTHVIGVKVTSVNVGSPADRADMEVGDIIVAIGENEVENTVEFERELTANYEPGDTARLLVVRGTEDGPHEDVYPKPISVTLEEF